MTNRACAVKHMAFPEEKESRHPITLRMLDSSPRPSPRLARRGRNYFVRREPRVVALLQPWANFRSAFSVLEFAFVCLACFAVSFAPLRLGVFALNSTLHPARRFEQYPNRWSKTGCDSSAIVSYSRFNI